MFALTPRYEDFESPAAAQLRELAAGETPWRYYLNTMVRIETPDLTGTVQPATRACGANRPPLGPLHVVTAVQPESDPASNDNSVRMLLLDNELRAAGLQFASAVGRASTERTANRAAPSSGSTTLTRGGSANGSVRLQCSAGAARCGRCRRASRTIEGIVHGSGFHE